MSCHELTSDDISHLDIRRRTSHDISEITSADISSLDISNSFQWQYPDKEQWETDSSKSWSDYGSLGSEEYSEDPHDDDLVTNSGLLDWDISSISVEDEASDWSPVIT